MFTRKRRKVAENAGEVLVDLDLVAEFLAMTAKPKWGWFNAPSLTVGGAEGTFGPRIDRAEEAAASSKRRK